MVCLIMYVGPFYTLIVHFPNVSGAQFDYYTLIFELKNIMQVARERQQNNDKHQQAKSPEQGLHAQSNNE